VCFLGPFLNMLLFWYRMWSPAVKWSRLLWRILSVKIRTLIHNFDEVGQKLNEVGQLVYEVGQLLDGVGQLLYGG